MRTKTKFGRDPEGVEPGDEAGELDDPLAEDDEVQPVATSRVPASRTADSRQIRILHTEMNRTDPRPRPGTATGPGGMAVACPPPGPGDP